MDKVQKNGMVRLGKGLRSSVIFHLTFIICHFSDAPRTDVSDMLQLVGLSEDELLIPTHNLVSQVLG